jgi:hypothetical protein
MCRQSASYRRHAGPGSYEARSGLREEGPDEAAAHDDQREDNPMLPIQGRSGEITEFIAAIHAHAAGTIDVVELHHPATVALLCTEGLRDEECDATGVPRGSSVAHAAQVTLHAIDNIGDRAGILAGLIAPDGGGRDL